MALTLALTFALAALLLRVDAGKATTVTTATVPEAVSSSIATNLPSSAFVEETQDTRDADHAGQHDRETHDLLMWAATTHRQSTHSLPVAIHVPLDTQFLVGVKSAVLSGFSSRQLIRQTWADRNRLPLGVHVVFLGCEPNLTAFDLDQQPLWQRALEAEKAAYGDLLTHELACQDSYWSLVHKVKGFLRWTTQAPLPSLNYVMLADDDVYIRVPDLFDVLITHLHLPRQGFYAGQVLATQFGHLSSVERDPADKNAVAFEDYAMAHKPPFATGAHYLLSVDLVHFLGRNYAFLRGVGSLEDVSIAYWLLALRQIRPIRLPEFENVRIKLCHNSQLAYADLTQSAIRQLHANLLQNRSLCDGFSFRQADKRATYVGLPGMELAGPLRVVRSLVQDWDLQYNTSAHTLQIHLMVSATGSDEAVGITFKPTQCNVAHLCSNLHVAIAHKMPTTAVRFDFCVEIHTRLHRLLRDAERQVPTSSHMYALALRNIHHGTNSVAVQVLLTSRVVHLRLMLECLLAVAFPDAHVEFVEEDDKASTPPDIVVATVVDLQAAGRTFVIPTLSRTVAVSSGVTAAESMHHLDGVAAVLTAVTTVTSDNQKSSHLYVPVASSSFANRQRNSPRALLQPTGRVRSVRERETVGYCASTNSEDARSSNAIQLFTVALERRGVLVAEPVRPTRPTNTTAFPLDEDVQCFQELSFAIVFEDHADTPGYIGHRIVSAFLAGSIPIYYGDSATAAWLFNRKAFIDCRSFASMADCAGRVADVRASPDSYDAMRQEPPVVNQTAFMEAFSWHPDATTLKDKGVMGQRFKEILLRV